MLTILFQSGLGSTLLSRDPEPKVGGCRDIARQRLVSTRIGKILSTLPTAGEPGWDRTNDLLIKSQLLYH
jgi:hypothetical protein